jgi:hypothetical protein
MNEIQNKRHLPLYIINAHGSMGNLYYTLKKDQYVIMIGLAGHLLYSTLVPGIGQKFNKKFTEIITDSKKILEFRQSLFKKNFRNLENTPDLFKNKALFSDLHIFKPGQIIPDVKLLFYESSDYNKDTADYNSLDGEFIVTDTNTTLDLGLKKKYDNFFTERYSDHPPGIFMIISCRAVPGHVNKPPSLRNKFNALKRTSNIVLKKGLKRTNQIRNFIAKNIALHRHTKGVFKTPTPTPGQLKALGTYYTCPGNPAMLTYFKMLSNENVRKNKLI